MNQSYTVEQLQDKFGEKWFDIQNYINCLVDNGNSKRILIAYHKLTKTFHRIIAHDPVLTEDQVRKIIKLHQLKNFK